MANLFFISDTHFGHKNILTFESDEGNPIRAFSCIEEMNEHMVQAWNNTVGKQDKVIHCGDVAFGKEALQHCGRLNGTKHLVLGNHDTYATHEYLRFFSKIYGSKYIGKEAICTHIPIHEGSFRGRSINIHGHLHTKVIGGPYFNVSVERVNYTPISLEEIKQRMAE